MPSRSLSRSMSCRGEAKLEIFDEIYLSWFELPYFWETKALLCMSESWWWCCDMTNDSYQVVRKNDGRCSVSHNHLLKQQTKLYHKFSHLQEWRGFPQIYNGASINVKIEFCVYLYMLWIYPKWITSAVKMIKKYFSVHPFYGEVFDWRVFLDHKI